VCHPARLLDLMDGRLGASVTRFAANEVLDDEIGRQHHRTGETCWSPRICPKFLDMHCDSSGRLLELGYALDADCSTGAPTVIYFLPTCQTSPTRRVQWRFVALWIQRWSLESLRPIWYICRCLFVLGMRGVANSEPCRISDET